MPRTPGRLPVLVLACALFVVTASEFQVAAMLTDMSADLNEPVADLGLLVTVYSLGMGFGGPAVVWTLRRVRAKRALVVVLLCYAVAETVTGTTTELAGLVVLRLVTGSLSGATFGLALTTGIALSGPGDRSRVSAAILTGLMAGTLMGMPLSHLLAASADWRTSFLALGASAVVMALGVAVFLPSPSAETSSSAESDDAQGSPGNLRNGSLWLRYLGSFLTIGGAFTAFAFIDPLLQDAGLTTGQVTLTMLGFGVAAFLGNSAGGRVTQGGARPWLLLGLGVQLVALLLFLAAPQNRPAVVLAAVLLGATGIALNPLLVNRVLTVTGSGTMVNTVHTSAITLGVAAATAAGGRAIHAAGGDLAGTLVVGTALTLAAGMTVVATRDPGARAEIGPRPTRTAT